MQVCIDKDIDTRVEEEEAPDADGARVGAVR